MTGFHIENKIRVVKIHFENYFCVLNIPISLIFLFFYILTSLSPNSFNPFVPNTPFLYPLKTSENLFSGSIERVHREQMG